MGKHNKSKMFDVQSWKEIYGKRNKIEKKNSYFSFELVFFFFFCGFYFSSAHASLRRNPLEHFVNV